MMRTLLLGILRLIRCAYCTYSAESLDDMDNHKRLIHNNEYEELMKKEDERNRIRRYKEIHSQSP